MNVLQQIFLAFVGLSGGVAVAGGTFALISILGVLPRLSQRLGMTARVYTVETMTALGGTIGTIFSVYQLQFPIGTIGLVVYGIFAGIFIGALSMALAEALRVIPILCQRVELRMGVAVIILMMALGKGIGTFVQMYIWQMTS